MQMNAAYFRGRLAKLWVLAAVAVVYIFWMILLHNLTLNTRLDGVLGVLGGLFVCSQPSANFVDILFFGRFTAVRSLRTGGWIAWVGVNLLVFVLGILMITVGTVQFSRK